MSETITLAHLTDVHLAPLTGFAPRYWNVKRALGYLNWLRGRRRVHVREVADRIASDAVSLRPDHVVVTGDLVNIGLPAEFAAARTWLESLGPPERVTVVPGNHDIYTARLHGASCLADWAPYMASDAWGRSLERCAAAAAVATFPFARRVGPVALIGLCSAVPTPPFVAAGRLGADQLAALGPILDAAATERLVRVVLIHHPPLVGQAPPRRGLADAAGLERVLERHGAELVLHGHNHHDMFALHRGADGDMPILGLASASAAIAHKHEPLARYNLVRISRQRGGHTIECVTRGIVADGGGVIEIARRHLRHGETLDAALSAGGPVS